MNHGEKFIDKTHPITEYRHSPTKKEEYLKLTGSQMNLTSRSQKNTTRSLTSLSAQKFRPCSAFPCHSAYPECESMQKRPMSADNEVALCRISKNQSNHYDFCTLGYSLNERYAAVPEANSNFRYCLSSTDLLKNLICRPWDFEYGDSTSNSSENSHSEKSLGCLIREMAQEDARPLARDDGNCIKALNKDICEIDVNKPESKKSDSKEDSPRPEKYTNNIQKINDKNFTIKPEMKRSESGDLKFQRWFPQNDKDGNLDEKIVRFSQAVNSNDELNDLDKHPDKAESDLDNACEKLSGPEPEEVYGPESFISLTFTPPKGNPSSEVVIDTKGDDTNTDFRSCSFPEVITINHIEGDKTEKSEKGKNKRKEFETELNSSKCPFSCCKVPKSLEDNYACTSQPENKSANIVATEKEEIKTNLSHIDKEVNQSSEVPTCSSIGREKSLNDFNEAVRDSTYDDIVNILNVLEHEATDIVQYQENKDEVIKGTKDKKNEQLYEIYSYLDEIEKTTEEAINAARSDAEIESVTKNHTFSSTSSIPRLEELLNKTTVELAHEILSLKLQIEDQSKGIKLLQDTIVEMKDTAKQIKNNHDSQLFKVSNEAEMSVQRHQKFIKQLLQEKKVLNEKVEKLVEDLKQGEERYQRNLKTVEQRHTIEIQRVKEMQAVAEKLKREKWIDIKTQKIKEMTVKGLEPELSRMAARQQQELTDLRNLHRTELEAVELRATRRTTELLDQLRSELNKEKEEAIIRETNSLRTKLEKKFEEERNNMEHEARKLREEQRREKEILENKHAHMQDTIMEMKRSMEREKERERQLLVQEFQEQTEVVKRRYQNEIKSLKDTLEIEKESWMNNYKKQQNAKFLEREAELHLQYKKERDREIELVIERIENESSLAQQEMNQAHENKFKRMKEKFEAEIKEMELTEASLKTKLSEAKSQLLEKDDRIGQINAEIHHLQSDITHLKKLCEDMSAERSNLKQIIEKEYETQLTQAKKEQETLKNEIAKLKTDHVLEIAKKDQMSIQVKAEAQQEIHQIYNRVKLTMSKKDEALKLLKDQHRTLLERCSHLETMLENQRRNFLLKK